MAYVVDLNGVVISTNSHLNRIKWGYIYIYIYIQPLGIIPYNGDVLGYEGSLLNMAV